MTKPTITLKEYADRIVTPMILDMVGLPDTAQGREMLDLIVEVALAD